MTKAALIAFIIITICLCLSGSSGLEIVAYEKNEIWIDECTLGLSFRCQDLQTAKRCRAVKECTQMAWENQKLPPDNSKVCTTCMEMVQQTRDELRNGTTQELVKDVLDDACNIYFQTDAIAKECRQQVDRFMFELQVIYASKMDSQSMCSVMLFCNAEIMNLQIDDDNAVADESKVSDTCQDCKIFAVDAIATTKTMDRNVFKQKLATLCNKLSGKLVRKECYSGVQHNSNKLYDYITTQMTPDTFCSTATMCVDEGHFRASQSDDPECDLCLEIVTVLKEVLSQKEFKTDLFNTLLSLCSWFGSHQQQCENDLKLYFDYVYEFLIHQLDSPKSVCQIIDICPSEEKFNDEDEMEKKALNSIIDISNELQASEEKILEYYLGYSDSYKKTANISVTCQHCQTFAIDAIAATKKLGRGAFKGKLMNMCTDFHVKRFLCKIAIATNGDRIYNGITAQMTPDDFCAFTTMCANEFDVKKTTINDFKCVICLRLVTEMRDFLQLNTTKNATHNAFLALCSILGPLEKQCTNIMNDKYFGIVYKFVILAMEPKSVCHLVDFCDVANMDEPFYNFIVE